MSCTHFPKWEMISLQQLVTFLTIKYEIVLMFAKQSLRKIKFLEGT